MTSMSLRSFISGQPAWRDGSAWHWTWAIAMAVLIFVAAQMAGAALVYVVLSGGGRLAAPAPGPAGGPPQLDAAAMLLLLASQVTIVVLTLWAASMFGSRPGPQLRLVRPDGGGRAYLLALLAMLPVIALVNAFAWTLRPEDALRDFRYFAEVARSPSPLLPTLAVCLGAPLSEELLFRGFLLAPLAVRFGYWPAATATALAWTVLHWGYSVVGLAEVLAIGIFLSWALQRTGSLYVPVVCHAVYNSTLFLLLRVLPAG